MHETILLPRFGAIKISIRRAFPLLELTGMMLRLFADGLGKDCPLKPNGKKPLADQTEEFGLGEMHGIRPRIITAWALNMALMKVTVTNTPRLSALNLASVLMEL